MAAPAGTVAFCPKVCVVVVIAPPAGCVPTVSFLSLFENVPILVKSEPKVPVVTVNKAEAIVPPAN
jgi:hypothetical protein